MALLALPVLGAAGCTQHDAYAAADEDPLRRLLADFVRPDSIPHPTDNAYTDARAELGKMLFFDPRLSASGLVACATCHNPGFHWGDGLPRAVGHEMKVLDRRTPTILNAAWLQSLFWDGRAETLEEQALQPIEAADEMNMEIDTLVRRLRDIPGYQPLFAAAYADEGISPAAIARALATFQRTVVSGTAPFDRWVAGDETAVSPDAKRGFLLFATTANCAACHSSWRFTDDSFHDIGIPGADRGRGAHVELDEIQFAFKTPTLRNVAERAPYMHDGSERTLEDVIDLYALGGRVHRPSLSPEMRPLDLSTADRRALLAFLRTLSSRDAAVEIPVLPQ
jgi:cytochrome c peroxidase